MWLSSGESYYVELVVLEVPFGKVSNTGLLLCGGIRIFDSISLLVAAILIMDVWLGNGCLVSGIAGVGQTSWVKGFVWILMGVVRVSYSSSVRCVDG